MKQYQLSEVRRRGMLVGYKAKIVINPEARPRFCKACSVPYAEKSRANWSDYKPRALLSLSNLQIGPHP